MGAVLTPTLVGVEEAGHLPNASTFCGRCESVCPMKIPLPKMMRHWRERQFERHLTPNAARYGLALWGFFVRRPALYHLAARIGAWALGRLGRADRRFRRLPLAGGWTPTPDTRAPGGGGSEGRRQHSDPRQDPPLAAARRVAGGDAGRARGGTRAPPPHPAAAGGSARQPGAGRAVRGEGERGQRRGPPPRYARS